MTEQDRATEQRIDALEQTVRQLRDCLEACAHPTEGWPLTEIANRFEDSRIIVPDDLPASDRLDRAWATSQHVKDWKEPIAKCPSCNEGIDPRPGVGPCVICHGCSWIAAPRLQAVRTC